jgi:hypothetical protein
MAAAPDRPVAAASPAAVTPAGDRRIAAMIRVLVLAAMTACSAAPAAAPAAVRDDGDRFGPLEVGADYRRYRRVTDLPYLSTVHGGRWVHVYISEVGADAYLRGSDIPVGTVVVKASWQPDAAGQPSSVAGPIFVMEKRAPGYAPDHGDWWFAIHWASPPPDRRTGRAAPLYWRGTSARVDYCRDCHDAYDRGLGGLVPSSVLGR